MAIKFLSAIDHGAYQLPSADGSNGQVLTTDGNGNVTFQSVTASSNYYLSGASFNTGNGILTLTVSGATDQTVDLDGRYALSSHSHNYDNYGSWNLKTNGTQRTTVQSGGDLNLVAGSNVSLSYSAGGTVTITSTDTNTNTTYSAGSGLSLSGTTFSHSDTSSASSVNNSGRTYIQDITIDTYGHVTAIASATETVTNTDTNYYLNGITKSGNTLTFAVSGATNQTYTFGSNAFNSTTIPTNNNQLTNGAGYITGLGWTDLTGDQADIQVSGFNNDAGYLTSVPSSFSTTNITVSGYIRGNGQQLVLNAGEAHSYATGQTAEYIYLNAEQGLEINSETGNWSGGWAARKTAYLRGDQLTLDGETLTKTNIQNFKTAYGWGNHASAGYLTSETYTAHEDTSTLSGTYGGNNNGIVIEDITVDSNGHVTAVGTRDLDGRFDSLGSAATAEANAIAHADDRIDNEVLPSIPTNNNQLTNGAGYITAVPSSFSTNSIAIGSTVTLTESSDRADLLYINSSTSSWGGLQIGNTSNEFIFSLMGDGTTGGIYDDQNADWLIQWTENAGVRLYHNAGQKLTTTSTGITITGEIVTTGGNSTNWNTAYGWGDHSAVGYLTSFTETDPVFSASASAGITSTNISNWNTAYGWGDHAAAGYVTSSGNTIIGTDSDIITSGATVIDNIYMTDGVITSHSTRTLTLANLGYTGSTTADDYGGWRISDGSVTEVIASGDTLIVTGAGSTGVTYDSGTNVLEISSSDTDTWRPIDQTPTNGATGDSISSDWAYDNVRLFSNGGQNLAGSFTATGDITAYSDVRVKENIQDLEDSLHKVSQLRGVSYNKIGSEEKSIGVIAQEIKEVLPEVVKEGEDGMLSVAYGNITAVLIEAIKEQQDIISQLEERIVDLENRI